MIIQYVKLQAKGTESNFISIPQDWISKLGKNEINTFRIDSTSTEQSIICSWSSDMHFNNDFIYINDQLMKENGFTDGEDIYISEISLPSPCANVYLELVDANDYNNVVINYDSLQFSILNQIRVIQVKQKFPLWLEGGCYVVLKVQGFGSYSQSCHILTQDTLVTILPPNEPSRDKALLCSSGNLQKENAFFMINYNSFLFKKSFYKLMKNVLPRRCNFFDILRSRKIPNFEHEIIKLLRNHPSLVIMSRKSLGDFRPKGDKWFVASVEKIDKDYLQGAKNEENSKEPTPKILCVVVVWEFIMKGLINSEELLHVSKYIANNSCLMSDPLIENLSMENSSIISIDSEDVNQLSSNIEIEATCPLNTELPNKEVVKSSLLSHFSNILDVCPIILNKQSSIPLEINGNLIKIGLISRIHAIIYKADLSNLPIFIVCSSKYEKIVTYEDKCIYNTQPLLCHEHFLNDLLEYIKTNLESADALVNFILLEGEERTGKSTIIQHVNKCLSESHIFCKLKKYKTTKGKKTDTIIKSLVSDIHECLLKQPSLLILDDIDYLVPINLPRNQDEGALYEHTTHLSIIIRNYINYLKSALDICKIKKSHSPRLIILASCKSKWDLQNVLTSQCEISKVFKIPKLSLDEKYDYFYQCISRDLTNGGNGLENNKSFLKEGLNDKFASLSLPELKCLSRRVIMKARTRCESQNKEKLSITEGDVILSLRGIIPLSTKKITSKESLRKTVGGLHLAKKLIRDSLLLPLCHPKVFQQMKLNTRRGILLFGPPGCGKTLLANSIAEIYDINFITVKGPELLSKYIGESERGVRNIFVRAKAASPCVIFFDEFDALAPRRGKDNTGVTDRVVNQLLTQMDGVESMEGTFIIAATSRPDLIDPALLRPGRLDKLVYCPIPTEEEREEIFEALAKDLPIDCPINWKELAEMTSNFTGADIQGVLSTSQVISVKNLLGNNLYKELNTQDVNKTESTKRSLIGREHLSEAVDVTKRPLIGREHLLQSIGMTRPSVSRNEIGRYTNIYIRYMDKKYNTFTPGSKYTLA